MGSNPTLSASFLIGNEQNLLTDSCQFSDEFAPEPEVMTKQGRLKKGSAPNNGEGWIEWGKEWVYPHWAMTSRRWFSKFRKPQIRR